MFKNKIIAYEKILDNTDDSYLTVSFCDKY